MKLNAVDAMLKRENGWVLMPNKREPDYRTKPHTAEFVWCYVAAFDERKVKA